MKRYAIILLMMCALCICVACDIQPQEIASSAITSFGNSAGTAFGALLVELIKTIGDAFLGSILMPTTMPAT